MTDEPAIERLLAAKQAAFWTPENLGANVFRVEGWLDGLVSGGPESVDEASGTSPSVSSAKLLFVLDNDYGELTTLMYLLLGQGLARRSTLLLPPRLYEKNAQALPGRTQLWTSRQDVTAAVESCSPDVVLFCSGYLFGIHGLLETAELERLVAELKGRGCRVVTADPYLGMLSRRSVAEIVSIDIPADAPPALQAAKATADERLHSNLGPAEQIFRDCCHLYPSHPEVPPSDASASDVRNLSFYNPHLILPEGDRASSDGRPHWLFIISSADYDTQAMFEGPWEVAGIIAKKLEEALLAQRHPILIGPDELIKNVFARMETTEGADILSFCPFNRVISLLLTAEHAFYWNVVSHSIMLRLFNGLPVVLFDKGHLARAIPTMYARVIAWYYQGWEPHFIDHHDRLTLEALAPLADDFRKNAEQVRRGFQRAPSPEAMVELVLGKAAIT